MTEKFFNPRTGEEEPVEYVVNAAGKTTSVSPDHGSVKVIDGGGDKGERLMYAGWRRATSAEIVRYMTKVERVSR